MAYTRQPAVAGQFYAGTRAALEAEIKQCFRDRLGPGREPEVAAEGPRRIVGLVSPHAGYAYSGPIAAAAYGALGADGRPDTVVVISPQHRGWAPANTIQTAGAWRTPLGDMAVDGETAAALAAAAPWLEDDPAPSADEHSLEVQLPFLQYVFGPELRFVPIMLGEQSLERARSLGAVLADCLLGKNAVIVASTDLSHEHDERHARAQDGKLIEALLRFDPEHYFETRTRLRATTCGFGPVTAMLCAARQLGAEQVEQLAYATSADVVPGGGYVVGYVAAAVRRGP